MRSGEYQQYFILEYYSFQSEGVFDLLGLKIGVIEIPPTFFVIRLEFIIV